MKYYAQAHDHVDFYKKQNKINTVFLDGRDMLMIVMTEQSISWLNTVSEATVMLYKNDRVGIKLYLEGGEW